MEIDGRKPGVKYLTRLYVLCTPWFGIMLHWFHAPDPDPHCHDHPWWFVSILLRGVYQERRQTLLGLRNSGRYALHAESESLRRGFLNTAFRRATDVHRITRVMPGTMTLIINGPKVKSWGFLKQTGTNMLGNAMFDYVPWREYLNVPDQTPEV